MSSTTAAPARVASIDALRGFDMFWIVGGGELVRTFLLLFSDPLPDWLDHQMDHVPWEGFVAWDLIMPLFMFVVGVAMPFSFAKRIDRDDSRLSLYGKIVLRTAILFVLGMVAQGNLLEFDASKFHFYSNTLQAIAAGYLVAAVVILNLNLAGQVLATAALLVAYWLVMAWVPVPGHAPGLLEPNVNFALYVDEMVLNRFPEWLGVGHFRDGTQYTWVLSSLAFAGMVLMGVLGGHVLRANRSQEAKVCGLACLGIVSLAGGWAWSAEFPIVKHLYTSSMVLWAAGLSYLLLAAFYLVIDVLGHKRWAFPFIVIGSNAIVAYMLAHPKNYGRMIGDTLVEGAARHCSPVGGEFMHALAGFAILWLVLWYMYRHKTFVRV
jgi:predicted acyltransferase